MSDVDFQRRIRLGEDSSLELKSVRVSGSSVRAPDRNDVADELAALANSRGGTMVLGVHDRTRRIQDIALDALDVLEGWVREICNDSVVPALDADILRSAVRAGLSVSTSPWCPPPHGPTCTIHSRADSWPETSSTLSLPGDEAFLGASEDDLLPRGR